MALIVQKFGGTSVGNVERIEQVADQVASFRARGDDVVVVVSAMSGETNRLIDLAHEVSEHPVPRELDVLVATGEQVTTALLAMALLGGAVFVADARLLGIGFKDVPAEEFLDKAHKVFVWGLGIVLFTGVFMACGVAGKIYFLPVFWYKMLALATGILFVFFIKRPLLARGVENLNPRTVKLIAVSSTLVWVTVAATGRWIGFAGS